MGPPILTVAYLVEEVASWHVFYLDRNDYVRELTNTNESSLELNFWQNGPLNQLNLKANDADRVGLVACYWGNFYGDSDYLSTSPAATRNLTLAPTGIHLWYADTDTSFQQYSWYTGENEWSNDNHTWTNMNGHAGVGCQTWEGGTGERSQRLRSYRLSTNLAIVQYVFMADLYNNLSIFWKDSNETDESPNHPINTWVNTSITIPNLNPSSSMAYTNYITFQATDNTIQGYNISWAAENTSIAPARDGSAGYDQWVIHYPNGSDVYALPGTQLEVTALAYITGGAEMAVYFQMEGMIWYCGQGISPQTTALGLFCHCQFRKQYIPSSCDQSLRVE